MNTPIRTGLASFGMSGSVFHAPFIEIHPRFELHSIVERSANKAAAKYPGARILRSFEALLSDPDIDLVIVNTPDTTHYELCGMALEAGKHVVVEKPFVLNVAEGEELVRMARERNLLLAVYQNRRWDGDFLTIREILQAALLGRVVEFHSAYQRYRNFIQENTWKERADHRVGLAYNLGSHMIDQAMTLFGMPSAVYADIDKMRRNSMVDDYYFIHLIYPDGPKVSVRGGYLIREATPRYYVHGEAGSFVKHGMDTQEDMLKAGLSPSLPLWGHEPEAAWGKLCTDINGLLFEGKIQTLPGNYGGFYDDIYRALSTDTPPQADAAEALNVIRVIDAAFESAASGSEVGISTKGYSPTSDAAPAEGDGNKVRE
ncbi:MAG: Gfo/Idh/MocA family oxidoreductase [Tannerellaceae bacterium]|jgi:predicted dehydrogenase|nr:Gfo/Idh/MocA family oxidoreductase [Tannerellaceae bacterium]